MLILGLVVALPLLMTDIHPGAQATEVNIVLAQEHEITPMIVASGTISYRNQVNITAEVLAKVTYIGLKEGESVSAGQLLLKLDPETYDNAIARESATLRQAQTEIVRGQAVLGLKQAQFDRSSKLLERQMIDRNKYEEDKNQLDLAKADLNHAREVERSSQATLNDAIQQRSKTEIRSPIGGKVVAVQIKIGEVAIPSTMALSGTQLMTIADTSEMQGELKVDETDIANIAPGQNVKLFPAAYQDANISGTVERIALVPTVEGQQRAYKVFTRIDIPEPIVLRSGMSTRANIYLGSHAKKLAVPLEAVVDGSKEDERGSRFIWVVKNHRAERISVQTGDSDDQWQTIDKGVSIGDSVIRGPARTLRRLKNGDPVIESRAKVNADSGS
ncbi:efflux RND transporter periplasmic adaptor subunit [Rudaea sp.]|uniref:efflux RND transporter periplasmic adaptor subunit n=1 Tax=Rudaea sp. TaxID=2136325 RepID=UPI003784753A